jgi:hypothetical protein
MPNDARALRGLSSAARDARRLLEEGAEAVWRLDFLAFAAAQERFDGAVARLRGAQPVVLPAPVRTRVD